jgi:hypothetical protein
VGAALNLLLKGIPLIYYGQELGMEGRQFRGWNSDANDIPVREAFPWTSAVGPGMAVWYKDSGPWWTQSPLARGGYVSLEAEAKDPGSLLAYYRGLIARRTLVAVNLSSAPATARVAAGGAALAPRAALLREVTTGDKLACGGDGSFTLALQPYGVGIFEVLP